MTLLIAWLLLDSLAAPLYFYLLALCAWAVAKAVQLMLMREAIDDALGVNMRRSIEIDSRPIGKNIDEM